MSTADIAKLLDEEDGNQISEDFDLFDVDLLLHSCYIKNLLCDENGVCHDPTHISEILLDEVFGDCLLYTSDAADE